MHAYVETSVEAFKWTRKLKRNLTMHSSVSCNRHKNTTERNYFFNTELPTLAIRMEGKNAI